MHRPCFARHALVRTEGVTEAEGAHGGTVCEWPHLGQRAEHGDILDSVRAEVKEEWLSPYFLLEKGASYNVVLPITMWATAGPSRGVRT